MSYFEYNHIVYVNSRDRSNGTHTDFVYDLGIDGTKNYDKIVLLDCSIPKSYYLVNNLYNTFILSENGSNVDVVITPGNYSRASFKNVLQQLLNNASPNNWTYTISYVSNTSTVDRGHFTYTVTGNSGIEPQFIFTNGIYELMGFEPNTTYDFNYNGSTTTLESVNVMNFNVENTLFLHCDAVANDRDNILQNIITTGNADYSYISFTQNDTQMYSKNFNGSSSSSCRFYLTNEDNEIIDTNGLNIVFTIMLYKSHENIDPLISKFIYYKLL